MQDRGPHDAPEAGDEDLGVLVIEEGRVQICRGGEWPEDMHHHHQITGWPEGEAYGVREGTRARRAAAARGWGRGESRREKGRRDATKTIVGPNYACYECGGRGRLRPSARDSSDAICFKLQLG